MIRIDAALCIRDQTYVFVENILHIWLTVALTHDLVQLPSWPSRKWIVFTKSLSLCALNEIILTCWAG